MAEKHACESEVGDARDTKRHRRSDDLDGKYLPAVCVATKRVKIDEKKLSGGRYVLAERTSAKQMMGEKRLEAQEYEMRDVYADYDIGAAVVRVRSAG